jgi:hypothetical protein
MIPGSWQPGEIAVLECPRCHAPGYYNEGSHFTCRLCDVIFHCCSEDEEPPIDGRPYLYLTDVLRLDDFA